MKKHLLAILTLSILTHGAWAAPKPSAAAASISGTPSKSGTWNLTLDDAVSLALRQNPNILNAKQEIERTRGQVIEVRAQALPQATVSSAYNQQDPNLLSDSGGSSSQASAKATPAPSLSGSSKQSKSSSQSQSQLSSFSPQDKSWNVTVTGKQLIYSGGSVRAALKIAHFSQDSSYFSLRETIDNVIATTRGFFYQVLVNRELIKVQEESVRLLQNQLKDQQIRFEAGTVPRFNVLQAEVAVSNALPALILARNAYLISQLNLAKVLGVDYGGSAHPVPFYAVGDLAITEKEMPLEKAIEMARAQRALLKVQRQQILIQTQEIQVALSGYKPTLALQGGYELRNSRLSHSLSDTVNGWFFGVTGSWNIFDGFETYGRTKQARAQLEQARISYNDVWHQVELEVQQAYANLQQAKELMQSQEKNVEQAEEAVRLATERLNAGAGTQLDVLSQTVALVTAMTTRLQARSSYIIDLAEYDRAAGAVTKYEETFDDPVVNRMRGKMVNDPPLPKP